MQLYNHPPFEIYQLEGYTRWRENAYVLLHPALQVALVIDPGGGAEEIAALLRQKQATAVYILLTHAHHDHVAAAAQLSDLLQLPCLVHPKDVTLLKQAPNYALVFDKNKITAPREVLMLDPEAGLPFAGGTLQIHHLPGHTNGSVVFSGSNFAFIGDLLMLAGKGRTDLPGGNAELLDHSLQMLPQLFSDETIFYPGHGAPFRLKDVAHLIS